MKLKIGQIIFSAVVATLVFASLYFHLIRPQMTISEQQRKSTVFETETRRQFSENFSGWIPQIYGTCPESDPICYWPPDYPLLTTMFTSQEYASKFRAEKFVYLEGSFSIKKCIPIQEPFEGVQLILENNKSTVRASLFLSVQGNHRRRMIHQDITGKDLQIGQGDYAIVGVTTLEGNSILHLMPTNTKKFFGHRLAVKNIKLETERAKLRKRLQELEDELKKSDGSSMGIEALQKIQQEGFTLKRRMAQIDAELDDHE